MTKSKTTWTQDEIEVFVERMRASFGEEWFELGDAIQLRIFKSRFDTGRALDRGTKLRLLEHRVNKSSMMDEYRVKRRTP